MQLYLTLDGLNTFEGQYSDIDETYFTIRRKDEEDNSLTYGFSGDITFYDEAYAYIYNKIIAPQGILGVGSNNEVKVVIYDSCCPGLDMQGNPTDLVLFKGKITFKGVDWCEGSCEVKCNLEEDTFYVGQSLCLKNTLIFNNQYDYGGGKKFQDLNHPFFWHCTELRPHFTHDLFMAIGLLFVQIAVMFQFVVLVISIVKEVIDAIGALFSGESPDFDNDLYSSYIGFIQSTLNAITGCSYGHPAPLIRDYIKNVCNVCNITLKSSIFDDDQSPYYNACLFSAPVHKGTSSYVHWIDDNKPLMTGASFLDMLKKVFNIDYRLENNTLTIERRDFFNFNTPIWIDASQGITDSENTNIISICYQYQAKEKPAFATFRYAADVIDWAGMEAKILYEEITDWNLPFGQYPQFKGEKLYQIPISPSRFRRDGIDRDVISDWQPFYDVLVPILSILSPQTYSTPFIKGALILNGGNIANIDTKFDKALLLPQDLSSEYKILIWDGLDYQNAVVKNEPFNLSYAPNYSIVEALPDFDLSGAFFYNKDMWCMAPVDTNLLNQGMKTYKPFFHGNLYDRFWYIDDPRINAYKGIEYTLEIVRDCDIINKIDFTKSIKLPNGIIGTVDEVDIKKDRLTIKGKA